MRFQRVILWHSAFIDVNSSRTQSPSHFQSRFGIERFNTQRKGQIDRIESPVTLSQPRGRTRVKFVASSRLQFCTSHLCRQGSRRMKKQAHPWIGWGLVAWHVEKIKPGEIALKRISHARLDLTNQPVRYVYHEYEKRDRPLCPTQGGETKVQVT